MISLFHTKRDSKQPKKCHFLCFLFSFLIFVCVFCCFIFLPFRSRKTVIFIDVSYLKPSLFWPVSSKRLKKYHIIFFKKRIISNLQCFALAFLFTCALNSLPFLIRTKLGTFSLTLPQPKRQNTLLSR